jgi:hypothetical protein
MARLKKEVVFPLVKGVLDGDLTRSEFDELTNLRPGGYEYWLRKFRSVDPVKGSFVPVRSGKPKEIDGRIEVTLPSGMRIKFSGMVSAQYLRDLGGVK